MHLFGNNSKHDSFNSAARPRDRLWRESRSTKVTKHCCVSRNRPGLHCSPVVRDPEVLSGRPREVKVTTGRDRQVGSVLCPENRKYVVAFAMECERIHKSDALREIVGNAVR